MALTDAAVRVGVTGRVFCGPVGTPMPTDVTTPLNAAFEDVGHISPDALTEQYSVTTELLKTWQRPTGVRTIVTEVAWTFKFQAYETSPLVLELYYGGAQTTTDSGISTVLIPVLPQGTEKAWVIEIDDGDVIERYLMEKGDITERGEVNHRGTEGTYWEMTVSILGTDAASLGTLLTNDPAFEALAS